MCTGNKHRGLKKKKLNSTVIREMQIKPQWDNYTHNSMTEEMTIKSVVEDAEQLKILKHCWWEYKNGTDYLENILVVCFKLKHKSTIMSNNPTPRYLPNENENLNIHKSYANVFRSLVYNYEKVETTLSQ